MTRMTGPDCAVMCNLINTHTHTRECGLRLTNINSIKGAVYIGCYAFVLGPVITAAAWENLQSVLDWLPERPKASAFLEEPKTVAIDVERSQIEDAVESSWVALSAEEDPQGRGIGALLVEAEAGVVRGRRWMRGGRETEGLGGGDVEQREKWEDWLNAQSDRENDLNQTNQGVLRVGVGVVPRV